MKDTDSTALFFKNNAKIVRGWPLWKKQLGRIFWHSGAEPCGKTSATCEACKRFEDWLADSEKDKGAK